MVTLGDATVHSICHKQLQVNMLSWSTSIVIVYTEIVRPYHTPMFPYSQWRVAMMSEKTRWLDGPLAIEFLDGQLLSFDWSDTSGH